MGERAGASPSAGRPESVPANLGRYYRVRVDQVRVRAGQEEVDLARLEDKLGRELTRRLRVGLEETRPSGPGRAEVGRGGGGDIVERVAERVAGEVLRRIERGER